MMKIGGFEKGERPGFPPPGSEGDVVEFRRIKALPPTLRSEASRSAVLPITRPSRRPPGVGLLRANGIFPRPTTSRSKGRNPRGIAAFFILFLLFSPAPVRGSDAAASLFNKGNAAYEAGRFAEAARAYEQVAEQGIANPALFYNLGNAKLKDGHLGEAVLWYERARRLAPRDEDILNNLAVARSRSKGEVRGPERGAFFEALSSFYLAFTVRELATAISVLWFLLALSLSGRFIVRRPALGRGLGWAGAISALLLLGLVLWSADRRSHDSKARAVVGVEKAEVLAGPSPDETEVTNLYEGIVVEVHGQRGLWSEVSIPGVFRGWMKTGALLSI